MNHIYGSIWSEALGTWIAVSENTKNKGKRSNTPRKLFATGLLLCSASIWALPTGDQLVAGQASVSSNAGQMQIQQTSQQAIVNWQGFSIAPNEAVNIQQPNAQAALLNRVVGVDASQIQGQLHANGQVYLVNPNGVLFGKTAQVDVGGLIASTHDISNTDFIAGKNHFTQNGSTGTVENQGTISVPEGGVVALISTSVTNTGTINTPKSTTAMTAGKTVDLDFQGNGLIEVKVSEAALNAQITNKGAIQADGGRVVLTAKAAGQLIDMVINQAGIIRAQGLVERNGEIILDGGDNGTVKVSGTLDVGSSNLGLNSSMTGGNINVTGQQIAIQNGANVNASGNTVGGNIAIGNKQTTQQTTIEQGATVSAQALVSGTAGTIDVFASMNNGTVNVAGKLDASAPKQGNGGFIDTSAAHVKVSDTAKISTKASNGKTGTWLIDPNDYTIAASGGDITGAALSASLNSTGVTISSTAGAGGVNGDVNVNDVVSWSANLLTLNAQRNININANLNGSGTAKLALFYGQASTAGGANDNYFINNGAKVTLPETLVFPAGGETFATKKGSGGSFYGYAVITSLSNLQSINGNPLLTYSVLGADIDASATSTWNAGAGFVPIGSFANPFTGNFDGLGHTITGLYINRPTTDYVGLFGSISFKFGPFQQGIVNNVGLVGGSVIGANSVGGLVGINSGGIVNNAYMTGNVSGTNFVGGLVGDNRFTGSATPFSWIINSYATGIVSGTNSVGGLAGSNTAYIGNSYATGIVSGTNSVGGLVGGNGGNIVNAYATGSVSGNTDVGGLTGTHKITSMNHDSIIRNTYATGRVSGISQVGGLVGSIDNTAPFPPTVENSFWDTQTTGQVNAVGLNNGVTLTNVSGKTTAEMMQRATFSNVGWDISNTGGSSAVWRIYEGYTAPLLRSFLTPLNINANISETYNGLIHNSLTNVSYSVSDAATSGHLFNTANPYGNAINVDSYPLTGVLYSDQQGYDISALGSLTITPATLTITANDASKTYGQTINFAGTEFTSSGLQNGETIATVILASDGATANAGVASSPYTVIASNATGGTFNTNNYSITYNNGELKINRAPLTIIANNDIKLFNGSAYQGGNGVSYFGFVNGENRNVLMGGLNYAGSSQGAINAGHYFITPLGFNSENYDIFYVDGTLIIDNSVALADNIAGLITGVTGNGQPLFPTLDTITNDSNSMPDSKLSLNDVSEEFTKDSSSSNPVFSFTPEQEGIKQSIVPTLTIQNSAGKVKRLKLSANKQFLSLLLEDGSVRVWDFQRGIQRSIVAANKNQGLGDVSTVNDDGELVSIASKAGIGVYDIIGSLIDDKLAINEPDVNYFASSNDGSLLLVSMGNGDLSLWDNKQNKELWQLPYQRGTVNNLALTDDKHYAAVLSRQQGVYVYEQAVGKLKPLTDAVDIIDLATGKIVKSLPNLGENVIYSRFKDNDTLSIGLANGELSDWSIATGSKKPVANFSETILAVDQDKATYAYITENSTVRIGNSQGDIQLSIQNKNNPITDAKLLANGNKLLTVLDSGDLALWDVASGKKILRLFSTQQGWTVMDAFGRFDGSDEAMENFNWIADKEKIPLDSFSENYYEPGLLSNILNNQDYLNSNPDAVRDGISLPPKVQVQLAEQQIKSDKVALKLDVYDRGGGIDKVSLYHNGKLVSNEDSVITTQTVQEDNTEHRVLNINVTPSAGKNTLKVVASNTAGIENSSTEISFDGKTKAYESSVRLMTVGINHYKERELHLNYTVADAELISETIKKNSNLIASKNLTNEKATKPHILADLKELSQGVQQDVLVIYFAGHGLALGKEWYFLPYETKLDPTLEQIAAYGITATELSDIFKDSKIQHILLMVDACYSGAGLDAFSKLENGQRYLTRRLGRSLGITVITAATKDQAATELKSLGHGLFTYLISQELANKESVEPITAHSIAENITKTLPKFSKEMLGSSQEPTAYTRGDDFMLTNFGDDKK